MKKLVGGIIIILAAAAVGFVGSAYWFGTQAERWYRDVLAEGSKNPNVKFTTIRYERGLFASHVVTRVQLTLAGNDGLKEADPSFSIRQDIYHGPLPLAAWGASDIPMQWGGGVIRSTLDPESADWVRKLAKLYGGREPITAIMQLGFDGANETRVTMPPLTLSNIEDLQSLNFAGLQGRFRAAPHGATVQGEMTVAKLDMTVKSASAEGQTAADNRITLDNLTMTVNQRKGAFDLMFGESSFKVGELRVHDRASGLPVTFTHLGMDATVSLNPQNPQQVAIEALFKADRIATDKRSGSGSLRMAFRNLDGATVARLQQWQQNLSGKPGDTQALDAQALDELLNLAKALLVGKPEFMLDTQAQLTNEGDWQGKLTLNLQDFDMSQASQSATGFLAALEKGLAEMTVSKALLEKELNDATEGKAVQQLQTMTAAGFIRVEGEQYKSTARFEGGKLFVNDKEIPLASASTAASETGETDAAAEEETPLGADGGTEEPAQQQK